MDTQKRPGLSRAERSRMKALMIKRRDLLTDTSQKITRRMELVHRRAPAEWLNRLTDEIHGRQRLLELVELELSDLMDRDWLARKAAAHESRQSAQGTDATAEGEE